MGRLAGDVAPESAARRMWLDRREENPADLTSVASEGGNILGEDIFS